jgi:hypothetical protein
LFDGLIVKTPSCQGETPRAVRTGSQVTPTLGAAAGGGWDRWRAGGASLAHIDRERLRKGKSSVAPPV